MVTFKSLNPPLLSKKNGPRKTWSQKYLDPEKYGINMGLKIMSDCTELDTLKTMRIVIWISSFTNTYLIFFRLEIVPNNSTVKWHIGKVEPGTRDAKLFKWDPGPETHEVGPGTQDPKIFK